MKTRQSRRQTAKVSHSRWLAYVTASAATALAGSNCAEAAIHYSGLLHQHFPPDRSKGKRFPLDQAGDSLYFGRGFPNLAARGPSGSETPRFQQNPAFFTCVGIVSGAFRGHAGTADNYYDYVSKLRFGENIAAGNFDCCGYHYGLLDSGNWDYYTQWDHGTGFVGFMFNSGAGIQYGWARVRMVGDPENAFAVLDYAYADPGEPIRTGQTSSDEQSPAQGSLGWLALGAVGLLAWRKSRSRTARYAKQPLPV